MKRLCLGLIIIGLAIFLTNTCTQGPDIITVFWEEDGNNYVQFSTNDPAFHNCVFWCWFTDTDQVAPMTDPVTGIVRKISGADNRGFGIIFCLQDSDNFFYVLITPDGYYDIGEEVDRAPSKIVDYTFSSAINTGLGASNTISVTYTIGTNTMAVSINGTQVNTFKPDTGSDPYIENWTGGKAGFIATTGFEAEENFPDTPCDVRFQLTSPDAIP